MLTFKSPEDLSKPPETHPAYATVKELVDQLITAYTPPARSNAKWCSKSCGGKHRVRKKRKRDLE